MILLRLVSAVDVNRMLSRYYNTMGTRIRPFTMAYYEDQTDAIRMQNAFVTGAQRSKPRDLCLVGSRYAIYLWSGVRCKGACLRLHPEYQATPDERARNRREATYELVMTIGSTVVVILWAMRVGGKTRLSAECLA